MAASLLGSAAPTPPSCRRRTSNRTPWSPPSPSPLMLLPPRTPKPTSLRLSSPWTGLRLQPHRTHRTTEKKGPCRGRGVYASLFGVGAPEALVIGVVALLVFGPKGLAEVARNLGKTLRTFQPTIRELQEVSREFKSTLEQEIGLNDVTSSLNSTYKPTSFPNEIKQAGVDTNGVPTKPYTSEDLLKVTEEQLAASGAKSQTEASIPEGQPQDGVPTKPYTSEDLLEVTEAQLAASGAKSQTEASIPEGQPQAAPTTPEVTAATSEIRISAASIEINVTPEVQTSAAASETAASTEPTVTPEVQTSGAAQTPSSEEVENERL